MFLHATKFASNILWSGPCQKFSGTSAIHLINSKPLFPQAKTTKLSSIGLRGSRSICRFLFQNLTIPRPPNRAGNFLRNSYPSPTTNPLSLHLPIDPSSYVIPQTLHDLLVSNNPQINLCLREAKTTKIQIQSPHSSDPKKSSQNQEKGGAESGIRAYPCGATKQKGTGWSRTGRTLSSRSIIF